MAEKELARYVKEHLEDGFSEDDIRLELVRQGYNVSAVESALKEAKLRKEKPKKFPLKLFVLLTIIIAVGVVLFFVFMKFRAVVGEEKVVSPVITPPAPEAAPGVLPEEVSPYLPVEEEMPEEAVKVEEAPPAGRQVPVYDVSGMSFNLTPKLQVINDVSLQNPDAAIAMCSDFHTSAERDVCFAMLAKSIPDNKLCGRVTETILRDQCYVSFAVTGTDTCSKINDTMVKETCDKLIKLNLSRLMP
ncbi:MAG: hypothetical protein QW666_01735 [Candidatus Woesearchaeota archaeon]